MGSSDLIEQMKQQSFFKGIDEKDTQEIANHSEFVDFDDDETIFSEGDKADKFYLVLEGRIAVSISIPGQDTLCVQTVGPDDVLGWSWLVPPYLWRFDAKTTQKTRAIAVDGAYLREKGLLSAPTTATQICQRVLETVADRVSSQTVRIVQTFSKT